MAGPTDPKAAEELAKKMQDVKNASNEATRAFQEQLRIITQMRDVMAEVSLNTKAMCQNCDTLTPETWQEIAEAVEKNNGAMTESAKVTGELSEASKKAAKSSKDLGGATKVVADVLQSKLFKGAVIATGGLKGLGQGISNVTALVKGMSNVFGGVIGTLWDLGKALFNTAKSFVSNLGAMANAGAGGNELAAAYQEVVKTFGTLKSGSGKAIVDAAHNIGTLNETGISSFKIFGNMAERVKAAKDMADGLGASMSYFKDEVQKNGGAMMIFNKGLGITSEQMQGISEYAKRMGKSITSVQIDMTKHAVGMAKAFQLDAKVLSKDMAAAMKDLAHFGHLGAKEMAVTAAFAQKMGVSVDKLTSVLDATKTFDQTADSVNKLNEQFGLNLQANELLAAENPADQIAIVQKAFKDAGKDVTQFNRFQKDLIRSTGLLGDELMDAALSSKGMATDVSALRKEADKNEASTMDQTKAMKELAKHIEVMTPSGGGMHNTVTENIAEGIWRGISMSPKFIKLMQQIREIFREAINFGYKLGRMFMDWSEGSGSIMDGLLKIFNPATYRKLFADIIDAFDILKKGGPEATKEFFSKVLKSFKEFFFGDADAMKIIGKGLANIGDAIFKGVVSLGNFVIDGLKEIIPMAVQGIKDFVKWMSGPGAKEASSGLSAKVTDWFGPMLDMLGRLVTEVAPMLWDALKELLDAAGQFIKDNPQIIAKAIGAMLLVAFGPALLGAALSAISASLIASIGAMLSGVGAVAAVTIGPAFAAIGSALITALSGAAIVGAVGYAAVNVGESIRKYGDALEEKGFDPATAKIAAGTTGLINTLTFGLLPDGLQAKIAESIAKMSDWIFKSLSDFLGPSFATSLKERLASAFQVFGGIGDLIVSLWNGDDKGTEQAFRDIGEGVLKFVISSFEFLEVEIPLAVLKIGAWLLKGFASLSEWIFGALEKVFHKLEKIPILGPLFGLIGDIFGKLKNLAGELKNFWDGVLSFLKLIDIPAIFKNAWDAVSNFFKSSEDGANGFLSGFAEWGRQLFAFIEAPWNMIRDLFNAVFSWDSNKSLFENLSEKIQNIGNILSEFWDKWVDQFAEVFIGGFVRAKNWFSENFSWQNFSSIVEGIIDGIKAQFDKITEFLSNPFKAGLNKVKIFFGIKSPSKEMAEVGKDIADGLNDGTSKIPEDMKKTAADASEALKNGISPAGAAAAPNMITPEQIENTGRIMQAVMNLAGKIPVDASIKQKLDQMNDILETLGKITSVLGDVKSGTGDLDALNKNMHFIYNILQTLNGELRTAEAWSPSLQDITAQFEKMNVSKLSSDNAIAVGTLLENLNKITTSISNASSSVIIKDQETPIQAVGRQLTFVHNILKLLNGQTVDQVAGVSLSTLTTLIDSLTVSAASLEKAESVVKISQKLTELSTAMSTIPDNMNTVKEAFAKMSGNSMTIQTNGMVENIKAVQDMVAKTRELDEALSKMPTLKFPAKLDTIANGMGIGGKFAYTVQSKEVVINVAFEVSMDVDKVEKVIITRQQSVIRDRLNFIMDNTMKGNSNTANALIKKQGEQSGNVNTNQP